MATLIETLQDCFSGRYHGMRGFQSSNYTDIVEDGYSLMTIPVRKEDTFEVPMDAFDMLKGIKDNIDKVKSIVMSLSCAPRVVAYKTLDATLRNYLSTSQEDIKLLKVTKIQDKGWYYNSFGTIYDNDFYPIMMCSWIVKVVPKEEEESYAVKLVRPILRVDPQVFINKSNTVERYIINKIVPTALELRELSIRYTLPHFVDTEEANFKVKIEIDKCPFIITKPVVPTIETTNESLVKAALTNIDDMTL